jgi:hypothetical protein
MLIDGSIFYEYIMLKSTSKMPMIRHQSLKFNHDDSEGMMNRNEVLWKNMMASKATYNRSLDHNTVYIEQGLTLNACHILSRSNELLKILNQMSSDKLYEILVDDSYTINRLISLGGVVIYFSDFS